MRVGVCELEREKIGIITNPNYYKLLQRCQTIEEKDERFRSIFNKQSSLFANSPIH